MTISKEKVVELTKEFGGGNSNTGSTEAQIAIITERIKNITEHLNGPQTIYSISINFAISIPLESNCSNIIIAFLSEPTNPM